MNKYLAIALLSSVLVSGSLFADEEAPAVDTKVSEVVAEAAPQAGYISGAVNYVWNKVPGHGFVDQLRTNHPYATNGVLLSALTGGAFYATYKYCPWFTAKVNALLGLSKAKSAKAYL